jgi:hypothetical protein
MDKAAQAGQLAPLTPHASSKTKQLLAQEPRPQRICSKISRLSAFACRAPASESQDRSAAKLTAFYSGFQVIRHFFLDFRVARRVFAASRAKNRGFVNSTQAIRAKNENHVFIRQKSIQRQQVRCSPLSRQKIAKFKVDR